MPIQFPRVNPGDVIQASQWNAVLDAIENIYGQIGATVSNNVAITGFVPPGPVNVGDPLTIQGRNFDFTVGALRLFFDSVAINSFKLGSSDTQLLVDVPDVGNLPPQGRSVSVTAYNRYNNDQKFITVIPVPTPLTGTVSVSPVAFSGTPTAGQSATFPFVVTSGLSLSRILLLAPSVSVPAWQNLMQVLDANQRPIEGGQITLAPNQNTSVFLSLAIPANTVNNTSFSVKLDVIDTLTGSNFGSSGGKTYVVGQASQDDPNIQFNQISLVDFSPPGQTNVLNGTNITLKPQSTAIIRVVATFKAAALYTVSVATSPTTSGWTPTLTLPSNGQFDFRSGIPPAQNIQFSVQSGSAGGELVLRAQTQNQNLSTSVSFTLSVNTS
jgi:hypothetical protein